MEDQKTLLDSVARGLREEGYEVATAADVADARSLLDGSLVDAVILDLMLPDRSGLSLLGELRQQGFNRPIVIITARDTIEDRVEGLDKGADDYLVKPFAFDELLARLRAVLRRTSARGDSSASPAATRVQVRNIPVNPAQRESCCATARPFCSS